MEVDAFRITAKVCRRTFEIEFSTNTRSWASIKSVREKYDGKACTSTQKHMGNYILFKILPLCVVNSYVKFDEKLNKINCGN